MIRRHLARLLRLARLVRVARLLVLATVVFYVVTFARALPLRDAFGNVLMPDFVAHYTGGHFAHEPGALYSLAGQTRFESTVTGDPTFQDLFLSPPFVAQMYAPLAALPLRSAMFVWALLSAACFAASYALLRADHRRVKRTHRALFLLFALAFQPLVEVFGAGQDTGLTVLLWAIGIHQALRARDVSAGLAFGCGVIKPQLFLLPAFYFGQKKRWRAVLGMALSAGAVVTLDLARFGTQSYRDWLALLGSAEYLAVTRQAQIWKMHSLFATLEGLVPATSARAADIARGVGLVLAVAVAVATLRHARRARDERYAWALLVVGTVIVSPHLFSYDLSLLLVPALLLLGERWGRSTVYAVVAMNLLVWLSAPRAAVFGASPWPLSALAAPLTVAPLLLIWCGVVRRSHFPVPRPTCTIPPG